MKTLLIIPTQIELTPFMNRLQAIGSPGESKNLKSNKIMYYPSLALYVGIGGLGKTQFGVQTQFYIDNLAGIGQVICLGAAGSLSEKLQIYDIVVGEKTIEHDIKKYNREMIPVFEADKDLIEKLKLRNKDVNESKVHFGIIASGDEDVLSDESRERVLRKTKAIAVAWEGVGGARASRFNDLPFVEIRGISDNANCETINDFHAHIEELMEKLADYIYVILK
jgi:adenosylhomocysteine nucleosidase